MRQTHCKVGLLILLLVSFARTPSWAGDIQLISLNGASTHVGSKVWSGKFRGLNGRDYNASEFYQSQNQEFSATGVFMLNSQKRISYLLPVSVDAGYKAQIYQAQSLASIGFGAAISIDSQSVLTLRVDNLLVIGGKISEQPCYDSYRRRYHCGTGSAWRDFERVDDDRRGSLAVPGFQARFIRRFSF